MYPLQEPELAFYDVGRHWHRYLPHETPRDEVYGLLLQAFWRGELPLCRPIDGRPADRLTALATLRRATATAFGGAGVHDPDDPPNLVFWAEDEEPELGPSQTMLPDGSMWWDPRHRIHLSLDQGAWTSLIVDETLATVAAIPFQELPLFWRGMTMVLRVRQPEFAALCTCHCWANCGWWVAPDVPHHPSAFAAKKTGRRMIDDEPQLEEMHRRIAQSIGKLSMWDAAGQLAELAPGDSDVEVKRRRLVCKYRERYLSI